MPTITKTEKARLLNSDDPKDAAKNDGNFLVILFALYVFLALMNRLFQKLQTYPMYNYPITLNQLTIFAYIPLSFLYIIPKVNDGTIPKAQTAIPKYKFIIM